MDAARAGGVTGAHSAALNHALVVRADKLIAARLLNKKCKERERPYTSSSSSLNSSPRPPRSTLAQ